VPSQDGQLKAISQWNDENEAWKAVLKGIKAII